MSVALALLVVSGTTTAFAPAGPWGLQQQNHRVELFSTLEEAPVDTSVESEVTSVPVADDEKEESAAPVVSPFTASEYNVRLEQQLEKLRQKDSTSPQLSKEVSHLKFCSSSPGLSHDICSITDSSISFQFIGAQGCV